MTPLDWVAVAVIVGGMVYLRRRIAALVRGAPAWVRARPPLGLVLAITLSAVAAVLIAWKVPIWQLASRAALLAPDRYLELQNSYRATIVQSLAGAALLVTIYLTWRRVAATERQVEIAGEGQITERFTRAIEQLGQRERVEIRLGGIYALERIARDSEKDHWTIMEVLTAYLRQHVARRDDAPESAPTKAVAIDVQAILTVIGRRRIEFDPIEGRRLDLTWTNLFGADLFGTNLSGANLEGANLSDAVLMRTNLSKALLLEANLSEAKMFEADLSGASLRGADLSGAVMWMTDLSWADLSEANLSRADLSKANLSGASLRGANLSGVDLSKAHLLGANLSGATLAGAIGLTHEQIESAITDEKTILPGYLEEGGEGPPQEAAGGEGES